MKRYKDLDFKDKLAYITCIVSFALGWFMVWASFLVSPLGEISDGALWVLGQSMLYTSAVLGISMFVTKSIKNIRHELGLKEDEEI